MADSEVYMQPNGSEVYVKLFNLPLVQDGDTGAGAAGAIQYYAANGNNNWDARNYGAPWTTGESFSCEEDINADPTQVGSHQLMYNTVRYTNLSYITNYNISSSSVCPNIRGTGKFGSTNDGTQNFSVSQVKLNLTAYSVAPSNTSGMVLYYYNSSVENWVRKLDTVRYRGFEDNVIIAYESENFQRSNLVVTDTGAGQAIDVSLNITNDTGVAQKFNALLCIMDYDIKTQNVGTTKYLIDGATVFPAVDSPGGTWPYYPAAIKTTATLANGATEKVTWTNASTLVSGHSYWIWCSGMIYGPWTAR
jgi:hypothetical protein